MTELPKEVLEEFINEAREMCERVSLNLGFVEKNVYQDETLNSIYRDIHSIKGSSQLFGFKQIGMITHAMESTLDPIRHRTIDINSDIMDGLYAGLDIVVKLILFVGQHGEEGIESVKSIEDTIPKLAASIIRAMGGEYEISKDGIGIPETKSNLMPLTLNKTVPEPIRDPVVPSIAIPESLPIGTSVVKQAVANKDDQTTETGTIRIQVGLLDNLMNMIGELVLIRNQLLQIAGNSTDSDFIKIGQRLNVVTSELQNDVMKTRMQPVGSIVTKFHRVVRDLSRDLGKKMELKIEGAETELDKTLIEAIKDPLTHIVRNCVDHAMEKPEERRAAGKRETGTVTIKSYHEGGQVIIEIADDGRGIVPKKIGEKAVEKGVITQDHFSKLSDIELQMLIFAPGFSTAEAVSNISGRGVGMDVVKTNIERIGGTVDLISKPGVGTTIRLRIPLTLAIIPALVIEAGGARFAVPQIKVRELVRVENDSDSGKSGRIEYLQDQPVYRLRGTLLPLVDLRKTLKLPTKEASSLGEGAVVNIIVLHTDHNDFGLIVDEIVDSSDIVVKPLSQALKGLNVYSGATIMGDGTVILILDVGGIACEAGVSSLVRTESIEKSSDLDHQVAMTDIAEYLLVDIGVPSRYAIPLCLVNRLEKFAIKQVEKTGNQRIVRYRDSLLPLIHVNEFLGLSTENCAPSDDDSISAIVMTKGNRDFGLQVLSILDVVQVEGNIDMTLKDRVGIHGTLIHNDKAIVVLDTLSIMEETMNRLDHKVRGLQQGIDTDATPSKQSPEFLKRKAKKILLAEDTPFFRKHIKTTLEGYGFHVIAAVNGDEAFKFLESSQKGEFSVLISDIEMPVMNGFELAGKVRSSVSWRQLPMIALTTRFRDRDLEMGREVGFTHYLEKFNPERLLAHLDDLLQVG